MSDDQPNDTVPGQPETQIVWHDNDMRQTFANVVNVAASTEEISLLFGTNREWRSDVAAMHVDLTDRLMLTPHAAKRLSILLARTIRRYEERQGPIALTPANGPAGG